MRCVTTNYSFVWFCLFSVNLVEMKFAAHREVEQVAALNGVRLRAGCFCNPGCCAGWLGLTAEAMVANYRAGRVCWDDTDLVDGAPRCTLTEAKILLLILGFIHFEVLTATILYLEKLFIFWF